MATEKRRIQAYLSEKLYQSLQDYSEQNKRSVSSSVEFLLQRALKNLPSRSFNYQRLLADREWDRP